MKNNKLKKFVAVALVGVIACSGLQVQPEKVQAAIETESDTVSQTDKKAVSFTVEQTEEKEIFAGTIPESADVKVTNVTFADGTTEECVWNSSDILLSLDAGNSYQVGENTLQVTYMGCTKSVTIHAKEDEVVFMNAEQSNLIICPGDKLDQSDFEVVVAYRSGKIDSNYTDYEIVDRSVTDATKSVTLRCANGIETVVDLTISPLEPERIAVLYNGAAVQEGCPVDKNDFTVTLIYNNGKEVVLENEAFDLLYDNIVEGQSNAVEVVYRDNTDICETIYVTGGTDIATEVPLSTTTPDFVLPGQETAGPEGTPDSTPESTSGNDNPAETTTEPEKTADVLSTAEPDRTTDMPTATGAVETTSVPVATESAATTPEVTVSATPNAPESTTPGAVATDTPGQPTTDPNGTIPAGEVTTGASVVTSSAVPTNTETPLKNSRTTVTLGVGEKVKVTMGSASKETYKTSNDKIVTVTEKGIVKAKKVGKAQITATDEKGNTKTYVIMVKKAPKKVKVNFAKKTMKKGKKATIKVSFVKGEYSSKNTFQSSNKKVATVSGKGVISARKKGTCRITVKTYNGKKAVIKIIVR